MTTREQIASALFDLVKTAANFAGTSRRFVHWDQVDVPQLPFLTMIKAGEDRRRQEEGLPILALNYHVLVYIQVPQDPTVVPDTHMNLMLDAIDATLAPTGGDALSGGRQTLGGLVSHCYALGSAFVDNGDIDGKGIAAIPVQILTPWY
jgi:hypothetical protein